MNPQEKFWSGSFGDSYSRRNTGRVENNIKFFKKALASVDSLSSVIEFGANIGENLQAITSIYNVSEVVGVEINELAINELKNHCTQVFQGSLLEFYSDKRADLTFTKGVLIHINPKDLPRAYEKLFKFSKKYILIAEYFSTKPQAIEYRGHSGRLWKRDFCQDMMNLYPDLKLIDYGFSYHTDGQDDLNFFLMEKK